MSKPTRPKNPDQNQDPVINKSFDPVSYSRQIADILERAKPILARYTQKHDGDEITPHSFSTSQFQNMIFDYWNAALQNPQKLIDVNLEYLQNMTLLWQETTRKFLGEESHTIVNAEKSDRRFRDPLWQDSFAFDFIRQSYLLTSGWLQKSVRNVDGLSQKEKDKMDFYTRQFVDALAPSNFAITNPEVIRATMDSQGQNLIKGLTNLVDDLERGGGDLEISKTQYQLFEVGKNLAVTPGSVVFENELMQLIQYTPSTKQVYKTPLLIVPPWINKYYILDMRPDNSYIKWAVDQGHTVFCISWVNPDRKLAKKGFGSYVEEGLLAALSAIELATGEKSTNVVGYCIGGTLLATALAYMTAKKLDKKISSATFLTTLIDFRQAGDLSIFVDDEQLQLIDEKMEKTGVLEGSDLRHTFSLLRANDLIWSFVVNNYMLGKEPFPFDLLYWNDDSTNMPAEMHSFYLRNMYRDNKLCRPNGITINETPIDVRKIKVPSYFISTKEDHIAPWASTYEGMHLLGGDKTFVLSASGHVAGVVNPPAAHKYHYWVNPDTDDRQHAEDWLAQAKQCDGSWWVHWAKWVEGTSGPRIPARKIGSGKLKIIEPAPGRYVKKKI
ncbi:MAG: class I poly(R)-hydroxyalkanoic acid synthase [Alphaproteobacteria bacterium]|nr:class I poly(R)-hydroxyalkanoic acid synthase [Alphaproteobacteria bacterium]